MLTAYQWVQVAQMVVMGAATVFAFSLRAGIKSGRWLAAGDSQATAVAALARRLDDGGEKVSTLATTVNGLPDRLRKEFDARYMERSVSEDRWTEIRAKVRDLETTLVRVEATKTELEVRLRILERENER